MTESETEDEILARIETALQKIATVGKPRPAPEQNGLNRERAAAALDAMIDRLHEALEPPGQDAAPGHHTE